MTLSFSIAHVLAFTSFTVSNFALPPYQGGFDRDKFWDEFLKRHVISDEEELVTLLLDLARCHWSPRTKNWPGMIVTLVTTSGNITVTLEPGKTRIRDFERGKATVYNWTSACLASAGIFYEIYISSSTCDTGTINGNWKGYTQYCTTLHGFGDNHYDLARANFAAWISSVGLKAQDPGISMNQERAAKAQIARRALSTAAYGLKNASRYLTGSAIIDADQPVTTVTI